MDGRPEMRWLVLALFCALVFALCAVLAPGAAVFDEGLLRALRRAEDPGSPAGPYWLREVATDFTALAGWPVVTLATVLISAWLIFHDRRRETAILLAVSIGHAFLVQGLKAAFGRPRPDVVPTLTEFANHAFPSGHSASAAALYLAVAALLAGRKANASARAAIFAVAGLTIAAIGASRVYLGVHYPTDVIAGFAVGAGWTSLVFFGARAFRREG